MVLTIYLYVHKLVSDLHIIFIVNASLHNISKKKQQNFSCFLDIFCCVLTDPLLITKIFRLANARS